EALCRLALFGPKNTVGMVRAYQFVPDELKTANGCALTWELVRRAKEMKMTDLPAICFEPPAPSSEPAANSEVN
ncbi:MAG: hypothetical protein AAB455_01335, partial [Patescibacteria group bacterium]